MFQIEEHVLKTGMVAFPTILQWFAGQAHGSSTWESVHSTEVAPDRQITGGASLQCLLLIKKNQFHNHHLRDITNVSVTSHMLRMLSC